MKEAYYFSHDSNAKDDPKCVMLIDQMGLEGYGIFWVLVEVLRDQPEYKYPLALIPALARRYNTSAEKMKTVIKNYNLFQLEVIDGNEQFFYSQSLCQRMALKEKISEIQRQKALKRWGPDATALPEQCHGNTTAMPIKESKGKESKETDKYDECDKGAYARDVNLLTHRLLLEGLINSDDLDLYDYDRYLEGKKKDYPMKQLKTVENYVIKHMLKNIDSINKKLPYFVVAFECGLKEVNKPDFDANKFEVVVKETVQIACENR
jgi:hypothetical protein